MVAFVFLHFKPHWNAFGLITIITNWNRMIVWPKVDACLVHSGYLVHNIVDPYKLPYKKGDSCNTYKQLMNV
jgi:hypothetical protein